jgi:hypothetical protein
LDLAIRSIGSPSALSAIRSRHLAAHRIWRARLAAPSGGHHLVAETIDGRPIAK